ncbi:MAG: O-antigen ligase family protein [Erythrobacter sp.]
MIQQLREFTRPHNLLVAYLAIVFLLGGGARDDILSLVVLRPLAIGVLAYALLVAAPARMRANRGLLILAGAWVALVAIHLVPLPPELWRALPGRELATEIDRAAGLGEQWRPLSLVPHRTLNALFALMVPLAALVLAVNCSREGLRRTVLALIALALLGALLSLLQVIGGEANAFYLYRITNADSAVGLFANRNHNAVFFALAIAMLGALHVLREPPRELRDRWALLFGGGALALVPFLVITQSRAGLALGLVALAAWYWLQRGAAHAGSRTAGGGVARNLPVIAAGIGALALAGVTWAATAGNALERLTRGGAADDELRLAIWPASVDLIAEHFPAGSGIGTFVEVFEAGEPASTLGTSYINHAHNDWLELAMTGGVPALALLIAGLLWIALKGFRGFQAADAIDQTLRRLGFVTLCLFALASLYDYPLRTPSLATVFILALVWIAGSEPLTSPEASPAKAPDRSVRRRRTAGRSAAQTGV